MGRKFGEIKFKIKVTGFRLGGRNDEQAIKAKIEAKIKFKFKMDCGSEPAMTGGRKLVIGDQCSVIGNIG